MDEAREEGSMPRATIALVADRSGYSVATVSRALHGDASVVAETREHVLRVCREVGYEPSIAGRRLSWGNKAVVGLSLGAHDHATGRFVALMHQALSQQLGKSGWSVDLITSDRFNDNLDIGGLILVGVDPGDPRPKSDVCRRIPTVAIGHDLDCFSVAVDDRRGGELAAEHLLSLGRKRLAVLHGEPEGGRYVKRVEAFVERLAAAGITPQTIQVTEGVTPSLQGYRALAPLLKSAAPFDGIFCQTDELAVGALTALEDAGIAVPRDVALIGFDDLPDLAQRLTTIRQDFPKLAEAAIKLLAEARRGSIPRNVLMPTELVRRQTT
jgi:LacI family transcriptional regulator